MIALPLLAAANGEANQPNRQTGQGQRRRLWNECQLEHQLFAENFTAGATATADSTRGPGFEPALVLDDSKQTYWATPDGSTTATLEITLPQTSPFSVIRLREAIALGQRVRKFAIDVRENGSWREWLPDGSSIGAHVLLRGKRVAADAVRILESAACPCISEVSLWLEPEIVPD